MEPTQMGPPYSPPPNTLQPQPLPPLNPETGGQFESNGSKKTIVIIISIILLVVLLIAAGILIFMRGRNGTENTEDSSTQTQNSLTEAAGTATVNYNEPAYRLYAKNDNGISPVDYKITSIVKYSDPPEEVRRHFKPASTGLTSSTADNTGAIMVNLDLINDSARIGGALYYRLYLDNLARIASINGTANSIPPVYSEGGDRVEAQSSTKAVIIFQVPKDTYSAQLNFGPLVEPVASIILDFAAKTYTLAPAVLPSPTANVVDSKFQPANVVADQEIEQGIEGFEDLLDVYYRNKNTYVGFDQCVFSPDPLACTHGFTVGTEVFAATVQALKEELSKTVGISGFEINVSNTDYCISHKLTQTQEYLCADVQNYSRGPLSSCGTAGTVCPLE